MHAQALERSPNRLEVIVPLVAHALSVFGDEAKATHWLRSPLALLNGHSPLETLNEPEGAAQVDAILTRIEHNVHS